jgi:polyhydroxyalkanoate synthase
MLMYPGGVLKDMTASVVTDNQLAKGRVKFGDQVARLDTIETNLLAFAGATDNLVQPEMAEKIVDIVASKDKEFRVAPGGHMGVIIGSKAQNAVWAESAEWLAQRSGNTQAKVKAKTKTKAKAKAKPKAKTKIKTKARAKTRRRASAAN